VLAAPCTALAGEKKEKSIDIQSYSWGATNAGSGTSVGGSQSKKLNIFKNTHDKVEAHSENVLTNKGLTTTNTPSALKGPNLLGGAGSGPTAGRATIKVSPGIYSPLTNAAEGPALSPARPRSPEVVGLLDDICVQEYDF
jgi:hypothetical protein